MLHGTPSRTSRSPHAAGHRRAAGDTRVAARHRQRVDPRFRTRPLTVAAGGVLALPRAAVLPVSPQWAAQALTKALAGLIVVAVFGLIAFFIVADERRDEPSAAASADALASRSADGTPLTLQEVFPDRAEVRPPGGTAAYRVTMTHIDSQCSIATVGALGNLLGGHGCSQVVRASLTAPYGNYQVTAGLFNLADAAGASAVDAQLRHLVETGDGSFAAMAAGEPGPGPATPAVAGQVGWHARGHYLLYCVITRPGGAVVLNDDPNAARINADLVDGYLDAGVLTERSRKQPE
ncbi:hypothetical protein ACIA5C_30875 [Actinoplanes sp. NPDC051343]|uniref:hypothetical protein n=1 Tax=Actinoplanes sp. NPDC051343 TaxID=3363906 RepID=UPI00379A7F1A